jgi:hypothetical protein
VGGVGGAAVGAQAVTVQQKKSIMRDWNEDPHEDEDEEVE